MQQIDWNKLGLTGESKQKSFEDVCMFLCCRELEITKIDSYQNQPGIETEPFEVNGKKYGFQAKFFDSKFDWQQIKKSIFKAIKLYPELDTIFIYSNKDRTKDNKTNDKTNSEKALETKATKQNISIKYITDKDILLKLSQPSNLDLAQLYFGIEDELGFVKNSVNPKLLTFIQSSEYLALPSVDTIGNQITNLSDKILENNNNNIFLLTGNPGSGKSILMHKLLEVFGGLDKEKEEETTKVLVTNNAVPVLINLKNCINSSLENLVRERKNDSKVGNQELGFIYLFDGLDELDESKADNVLFQIYELSQKSNTKKIIISCRSGNPNKIKAKNYFNDIIEYQISNLNNNHLNKYFTAKGIKPKKNNLKKLEKKNKNLLSDIKDILFIKLLWDTIEELDESSTILDLFSKKIDLLLSNPTHSKNIENLNLLNCKKEQILNLNQEISFEFQKRFQFRFSQKDLQKLILDKFPRLDYQSINNIINYIANLFFDNSYDSLDNSNSSFIYQHRRYQEYFFTKKLKSEYEKSPQIIRELKLLANREYFEGLFLPYLRKEYKKENNLPGMVELNLFDVYLGKHKGFGVDEAYYINSNEFIPALVSQDENIFNELLESENFQIKDKISIDLQELESQFKKWNKDKNNFRAKDYLKNIWQTNTASLIENIVLFWKSGNTDIANNFRKQLKDSIDLYVEYKFDLNINHPLNDLFNNRNEDWLYYRLTITNEKTVKGLFNGLTQEKPSRKESSIISFFRVCLKEQEKRDELYKLIDNFNEYEFLTFLDVFKSIEYLPIFVQSKSIHEQIKSFINNYSTENITIVFYKKYFNIHISKKETKIVETTLKELREKRPVDWNLDKTHIKFALISYILDEFSFEKYSQEQKQEDYHYYDELGLYSALFKDFIALLLGKKEIEMIVRDYIRYVNFDYENSYSQKHLEFDISSLWAYMFALETDTQKILTLKQILITKENNIVPFSFFHKFNYLNSNTFAKIISENDLFCMEQELPNWNEDFPSYVDRCFELSNFFSKINKSKALIYFEKGIVDGMLRHGYHKDTIISYALTDAFAIIWRNNWINDRQKEDYAQQVFNLTRRVVKITDGDHTWIGPHLLIEIVANTNIKLAEKFNAEFTEYNDGYTSNTVITSILKAKIKHGLEIEKIEKDMDQYRGNSNTNYDEQKFIVYLEIAESNLYTQEEQEEAFQKAYQQIEKIQQQKINDYLIDDEFESEKLRFKELCIKYDKTFNLTFNEKNTDENFDKKKKYISEQNFIDKVRQCNTTKQIAGKYKTLNNYDNGVVISKYESWEVLIQKTFEINKNLKLLFDYLLKNNFPHTDYWTSNSKYLHIPIAIALKNINTKQEALNYLFKNSGHKGFKNIMKSYEVMGDKNMCLDLFNRYLKFCVLIVDM